MSEEKQNAKKRTLTYDQRNDQRRRVPEVTERAMRACHLFAQILKDHFEDGICELMEENSYDFKHYTLNILNNLLLVGDIPRDILLGTAVKMIDITFNLRELTKIQLNHLTKYHSKKEDQRRGIDCVYFQHYLNKFEAESTDTSSTKNDMIRFHRNPYIFNAQYFVDILECSYQLQYKVSIEDIAEHGCIHLSITNDHQHEGYNLNGLKCRFADTFDPNQVLSVQKQKQNESLERELVMSYNYDPDDKPDGEEQQRKRTRWKSITLAPKGLNYAEEMDEDYKPLDIEIYDTRIKDKLKTYDFSINTAIIPLSSVSEFFDEEKGQNIAIWFWEYIIENGIDEECDAISDITINRILRVPQLNKDEYIINVHGGTYHFWRTVELMIRLPNFYINDSLIDAHIEHYDKWLNMQYFESDENRNNFINRFVDIVVNYCYCVRDLRAMLNVLEILEFNEAFSDLLIEFNKFNLELMAAIKARDYEELTMVIFISYGYPFKMKHQQNIELEKLKKENKELKTHIINLEQSKVQLAVNCTKAIDQCRSFLKK